MSNVIQLSKIETMAMVRDARIVGIRWDLIEWSLVLDLDIPVLEASGNLRRRGWMVFAAISDVTLDLRQQRLPRGIEIVGDAVETQAVNGLNSYAIPIVSMDRIEVVDWHELEVVAQGVFGFVAKSSYETELPDFDPVIRTQNASDEVFLAAWRKVMI